MLCYKKVDNLKSITIAFHLYIFELLYVNENDLMRLKKPNTCHWIRIVEKKSVDRNFSNYIFSLRVLNYIIWIK